MSKLKHQPTVGRTIEFLVSAGLIINIKTIVITLLSIVAMWFCLQNGYYADFPLTLVGIAVVFPVVFSINSAYNRREWALQNLAECSTQPSTSSCAAHNAPSMAVLAQTASINLQLYKD